MLCSTQEKEMVLDFGKWLSDNKLRRTDNGLWCNNVQPFDALTDDALIEMYCNDPFRLKNFYNESDIELKEVKKFRPITVNKLIYPLFDYPPYFKDGKAFTGKMKSTYKVGQVVYIKPENRIGVVLGIIDEVGGELRTDSSGMVGYDDIEFYNPKKHCDAIAHTALKSALKIFVD